MVAIHYDRLNYAPFRRAQAVNGQSFVLMIRDNSLYIRLDQALSELARNLSGLFGESLIVQNRFHITILSKQLDDIDVPPAPFVVPNWSDPDYVKVRDFIPSALKGCTLKLEKCVFDAGTGTVQLVYRGNERLPAIRAFLQAIGATVKPGTIDGDRINTCTVVVAFLKSVPDDLPTEVAVKLMFENWLKDYGDSVTDINVGSISLVQYHDFALDNCKVVPLLQQHERDTAHADYGIASSHPLLRGKERIDYDKYNSKLVDLAKMTDDEAINRLLSGGDKYHRETLQALPFEGLSVIHNIDTGTANKLNLPRKIQDLRTRLEQANVEGKIAFVDTRSFHATTFDLVNQVEHGKTLEANGYEYQIVHGQVRQAALEFLSDMKLKLNATVSIVRAGMFPPAVLKLDLEWSEVVTSVFQAYRLALHKYLGDRVGHAYSLVRDPLWNRELAGHITLGYVVKPFRLDEIDPYLLVIREFNDNFARIDFELTQGEVTAFSDMDHYSIVRAP